MEKITEVTAVSAVTSKDVSYLEQSLISLETSARKAGWHINFIIVANGFKINKINKIDSRYKIISRRSNIGFAPAINYAVKHAKTEWCIVFSPDTATGINCLNLIYPDKFKGENIGLVGPGITIDSGQLQYTILPYPSLKQIFFEQSYLYKVFPFSIRYPLSDRNLYNSAHKVSALAAIWWFVNKKAFENIGGFDDRFFLYFEDVDFCRRLTEAGYFVIYNPASSISHFMHRSTGGETDGKLFYFGLKKYLEKYYGGIYTKLSLLIFKIGCLLRLFYWSMKVKIKLSANKKILAENKIKYCRQVLDCKL